MQKKTLFALSPVIGLVIAGFAFSGGQTRICAPDRICMESGFAPDTMRKDPVCGMMADDTKKDTVHYKNKVYAFCSKYCKQEFVKNPGAHLPAKKNN